MIECQLFRKEGSGGRGGGRVYVIENEEYVRNVTGFKKQILKNTRNLQTPIPLFPTPMRTNIRSGFQRERLNPFIRGSRNSRRLEGRGRSGCGWKTSGPHDRGEFKIFKKPDPEKEAPVFQRISLSLSSLFLTFNPCSLKLNNPLYVISPSTATENPRPSTISTQMFRCFQIWFNK